MFTNINSRMLKNIVLMDIHPLFHGIKEINSKNSGHKE